MLGLDLFLTILGLDLGSLMFAVGGQEKLEYKLFINLEFLKEIDDYD
jgi:hypothetical protein